jgi:hypothetical protein
MTFYMTADGEGGKTLCGGLGTIPAEAQTTLDTMNTHQQKQFLRRFLRSCNVPFIQFPIKTVDLQHLQKLEIGREGKGRRVPPLQ